MGKASTKLGKVPKDSVKTFYDGRLTIFTAVKGLIRDGEFAAKLVQDLKPDMLALGLAPEDLEGLRYLRKRIEQKKKYEPDLSNIDISFVKHLSKFGDVDAPPPCFTMALDLADQLKIPVTTLDLDNSTHTDIYVKSVDLTDLLRQSFRFRAMRRKRFDIKTPEEFVLTWDRLLNKAKGFRIVEGSRELCMGETLRVLMDKNKGSKVLAIIELERAQGVIDWMTTPPDKKKPSKAKKKTPKST
jgi:hypothetical protein